MSIPTKVLAGALFVILLMTSPARAGAIDQVKNVVNSINSKVNTIRSQTSGVASKLNDSAKLLSGNMQELIDDAVTDLKALAEYIQEERADNSAARQIFMDSEGELFRADLRNLLLEFELLFQNLAGVDPDTIPKVNFGQLIKLVNKIPLQVLWPVYKAMDKLGFLNLLNQMGPRLEKANEALKVLVPLVKQRFQEGTTTQATSTLAAIASPSMASPALATRGSIKAGRAWVIYLRSLAFLSTYSGKTMQAIDKLTPDTKKTAGGWGFILVRVEPPSLLESLGSVFESIGDFFGAGGGGGIADIAEGVLDRREAELNSEDLRETIKTFFNWPGAPAVPETGEDRARTDLELATWATLRLQYQILHNQDPGTFPTDTVDPAGVAASQTFFRRGRFGGFGRRRR